MPTTTNPARAALRRAVANGAPIDWDTIAPMPPHWKHCGYCGHVAPAATFQHKTHCLKRYENGENK